MATNKDDLDYILEMERRAIDARGPMFEALVNKAMHPKLRCPTTKREDLRISLYHIIYNFEMQRFIDQEYGGAEPFKWLKRVQNAATELAKLLEAAISPIPSTTVELASHDLRELYGGMALVQLEGEVRRLSTATKHHLAEIAEAARAETRRGRRPDKRPRELAEDLVKMLTQYAERRPGISRRGPMVRLVKAALEFLGEEEREDATIYDWMLKKP